MKINAEFIRTLGPCEEGIVNFETKYPYFEGSLIDVLELENIPYSDKVWLATKVVSYKQLQKWSLRCAKSVVHIYNREFPNDNTLNEVLDTVEKVINGESGESAARSARSAAESAGESAARSARSAAESAAWSGESAAWSAESAAWSAAWSAESAAWSVAELAARSARSAAWSAARSAAREREQEKLNIKLLIEVLNE